MRLQLLVPPLPQTLVDALTSLNIRTDAELLFSGRPADIFCKLPPGTVDYQEFIDLVSQVTERAAAPAIRGDQLWDAVKRRREDNEFCLLSTGVPELDTLLDGMHPPRVIEVSGDRGSGKTSLALQVVLRHLSTVFDSSALWIDTTGDFAPERIPAMLEHYTGQAASTVLERLQVALAFDIEAAHEVLDELYASLADDLSTGSTMRCVVIDAVTPLLGPLLSAVSSQGHAVMTAFMRQLRTLAETFSLTVLVINSSTLSSPLNPDSAFLTTNRKPALGPSFTFLTDTTLWLGKFLPEDGTRDSSDQTTHIAEIFRSRVAYSKTWCCFRIVDGILSAP